MQRLASPRSHAWCCAGAFAEGAIEQAPREEHELPAWDRVPTEVIEPGIGEGILGPAGARNRADLKRHREPGELAVAVTDRSEDLRRSVPPRVKYRRRVRTFVAGDGLQDRRTIRRACGLDSAKLRTAREERFPKDGVLDEIKDVRGVPP